MLTFFLAAALGAWVAYCVDCLPPALPLPFACYADVDAAEVELLLFLNRL